MNAAKYGFTAATVVCWSMISESQTRYGHWGSSSGRACPGGLRQGSSRAFSAKYFKILWAIASGISTGMPRYGMGFANGEAKVWTRDRSKAPQRASAAHGRNVA
jgi:hypothetical protein